MIWSWLLFIISKFSAPTTAFLAFWLAKKLWLWANSRSFTSCGKKWAKFKNFPREVFNFSPGNKNRLQNPVWEFTKTIIIIPFALVGSEVIITNWHYALVGYFITSYPTQAHGIIVIYSRYFYHMTVEESTARVNHHHRNQKQNNKLW